MDTNGNGGPAVTHYTRQDEPLFLLRGRRQFLGETGQKKRTKPAGKGKPGARADELTLLPVILFLPTAGYHLGGLAIAALEFFENLLIDEIVAAVIQCRRL